MSGAGSGSIAFAKESSFRGSLSGAPDYFGFGRDTEITELSLGRQLQRVRDATDAETTESLASNIEGVVGIESIISQDTHADVHDIVFNDGPGNGFTDGAAVSSRVFVGLDHLSGTVERTLEGCIPLEYGISYEQGQPVRYTLRLGYADETYDNSIDPTSVTRASDGSAAAFHGVSLDIDGATVSKLQSASLSIDQIAQFQRDADPRPAAGVHANPQKSLSVTAIVEGTDRTELAYGSAGSSATAARMDSVTGSLDIAVGGTTVASYSLPKLKPDSYTWEQVISADSATDTTQFNVDGAITVSD